MSFQPRFDEQRGIYRDCKWCGGKGCLACPGEAEKEYKRQFPDGPKPIASFTIEDLKDEGVLCILKKLIGPDAVMAAKDEGHKLAEKFIEQHPETLESSGGNKKETIKELAQHFTGLIIEDNIDKSALPDRCKK